MIPPSMKGLIQSLALGFVSLVIMACSGDGNIDEDGGSSGGGVDNFVLQAELIDDNGSAATSVSSSTSLTVRATLTNNGTPVSGQIISFAVSDSAFASLSGSTVPTNSEGVATVKLTGGTTAGNGGVTISADASLSLSQINIPFESVGEDVGTPENSYEVYLIPATTEYADYAAISESTNNNIANGTPATLLVKLSDANNAPISGVLVSVDFSGATDLIVNDSATNQNGKVLTDANGFATLDLSVGSVSGVGELGINFSDGKQIAIVFESAGDKEEPQTLDNYELVAALLGEGSLPASIVSASTTLTLQVTLTNNDEVVEGEVVIVSISDQTFASISGTTLTTGSNGIASTTVTGGQEAGDGTITITVANPDISVEAVNVPFRSLGQDQTGSEEFVYEVYLVPSSTDYESYADITTSTLTTISSSQPGTVLVQYSSQDSSPISRSLVTVSLLEGASQLATLSNNLGTVLTDDNGFATINLIATDISGAGFIQVEFEDGKTSKIAFDSLGDGNQEPTEEIGTIELLASSVQLASSGSDEVELLAVVKDSQNNVMEGIQVSFSSDSGAIQIVEPITASNGLATAKLTTLNNPETRTINISAFVGDKSAELDIGVTGTTIKITGNNSIVTDDTVEMTVVMLDSDGNGIPQRNIILQSSAGNTLKSATSADLPTIDNGDGTFSQYVTTDSTGSALFRFTADNSGADTLTASALGEAGQLSISISPDQFVIGGLEVEGVSVTDDEVPLSGGNFTLTWLRNDVPFIGDVLFSSTRGQVVDDNGDPITGPISTDANGQARVNVISSDSGPALLSASADGVSVSYDFVFVSEIAARIVLQASPASIGPNGQKSTISATVVDKDGNVVKNRPVNFRLFDVSGGFIFPETVTTDGNGLATTVYSSNIVSAHDGVVVAGCTDITGEMSECVNTVTTYDNENSQDDEYGCAGDQECINADVKLTVADRTASISLGVGNTILQANDQDYEKVVSVYINDIVGRPIANTDFTVAAVPVGYFEGDWGIILNEDGDFDHYATFTTGFCLNEDIDRDGFEDRKEDIDEDGNWDQFNEDLDGDGNLDTVNEDLDFDGNLDVDEDLDNDANLDVDEDIDGDSNHDLFYEYVAGVCSLDDANNTDLNNDGTLDTGEDVNCNGVLDVGEDLDGDGVLDLTEDLDGDGRCDRTNEDVDGDGTLDTQAEDLDGDNRLDTFSFVDTNFDLDGDGTGDGVTRRGRDLDESGTLQAAEVDVFEDIDGDGRLDYREIDYNNNGVLDIDGINEDRNQNGQLDPGNVVTVLGDLTTDENGHSELKLRYSESYGGWVIIRLIVRTKVSGTEDAKEMTFVLEVASEDTTNEDNPPTSNLFGSDGNCATVQ